MAKRKKRKNSKKQNYSSEITGLIFIFMAFFSIGQWGIIGRLFANFFRFFVGDSYYILSILTLILGFMLLFRSKIPIKFLNIIVGFLLMYTGVLVWMHQNLFLNLNIQGMNPIQATWDFFQTDLLANATNMELGGGMIGALLYASVNALFSRIGTSIFIIALIFMGVMTFGNFSYKSLLDIIKSMVLSIVEFISTLFDDLKENKNQSKKTAKTSKSKKKKDTENKDASKDQDQHDDYDGPAILQKPSEPEQTDLPISGFNEQKETEYSFDKPAKETEKASENTEAEDDNLDLSSLEDGEQENQDYKLPPMSLLKTVKATDQSSEYDRIKENVSKLEDTFDSFGVDAKVVKANLGPAVTKFEIEPAQGVKVSKVVNLTDDIALALAAKDLRMEAPIPGKSLIGIEVPNNNVSMVSFKEVMENQPKSKGKLLEVPLGRDISGAIQMADLSKMPHLLIAGATGSGKSVGINGVIASILMKAKPHEVKLMMVDPKMVELNVYNGIPHLLAPVVTNPKKAAQALHKVVQEMERRYELFAASGTRNMEGYNEFIEKQEDQSTPKLPYIVVIVDELADLMMVASKEVENAITRLAQMARAAGIHMILATQRPSVDVITGIIKANVPSRIAFAVSSSTDSRTILDQGGAEKLLGRGDMLFLPMGANKPNRVQGAFISDSEVEALVDFVKNQQEANYVEEMIPDDEPKNSSSEEPEDELYDDAKALVIDMQTASISMLQRRFRIGYNRAARIVDDLEAHGVIGPSEGAKPREVLVSPAEEENPEQPSDE